MHLADLDVVEADVVAVPRRHPGSAGRSRRRRRRATWHSARSRARLRCRSGRSSSTVAPLVMALSASVLRRVAARAHSRRSGLEVVRPAAATAFFRYGASNSTYRVEARVRQDRRDLTLTRRSQRLQRVHRGEGVVEVGVRDRRAGRAPVEVAAADELVPVWAGAELLLELVELLQPAVTTTAANAAAAVRGLVLIRNTTVYSLLLHSDMPHMACARPDPYNPVTIDSATGGNARSARRKLPVNTFEKTVKKGLMSGSRSVVTILFETIL